MGLFDYFKKDAADERKLQRASKKLTNMYYQSADRLATMDLMAEMAREGDKRAVPIMLSRFEHLAPSTTADQDEKEYLVDLLVDLGDAAEEAIVRYATKSSKPAYWPLQVLLRRWSNEKYVAYFAELLDGMDNDYHRDPQRKSGLVQMAVEYDTDAVNAALLKFTEDHHEDVRFHSADALLSRKHDAARPLLAARIPVEESIRLVQRIVEGFATNGWSVGEHAEAVRAKLPDGFRIGSGGAIQRA